jgi:hypothetical protein
MRLLLAFLLFFAPLPPSTTLQASLTEFGVTFAVYTTAPASFYVQIDTEGGAIVQGDTIYLFDLDADQTFAKTVPAARGITPGAVIVRVWISNDATVIEQRVEMPARAGVSHVYVPFALH